MVAATCIQYTVSDSLTRFQLLDERIDTRPAFTLVACAGQSEYRLELRHHVPSSRACRIRWLTPSLVVSSHAS